jgi:hypothetical protein
MHLNDGGRSAGDAAPAIFASNNVIAFAMIIDLTGRTSVQPKGDIKGRARERIPQAIKIFLGQIFAAAGTDSVVDIVEPDRRRAGLMAGTMDGRGPRRGRRWWYAIGPTGRGAAMEALFCRGTRKQSKRIRRSAQYTTSDSRSNSLHALDAAA